ncbi:MAG: alpha-glucan family phosphorylase [Pyrinomonadaceae bacterium]|nr:alpha-glucan family phosphorylase [Pyrinomonadaceae bacterium]
MQIMNEIEEAEVATVRALPETIDALEQLSWNYWWSWAADGASVFRDLDPEVWDGVEHNARRLLRETPEFRMTRMATDPTFIGRVRKLAEDFKRYMDPAAKVWAADGARSLMHANPVAYFCAEFGIHQSLPLYSGGLGMLAGDHLKSASDLGLPLVAVGLLYHHGYFRQRLRRDGWQEEHYGKIDTDDLPIQLVHDEAGTPLRVELLIRGRGVECQAWRVDVGRVKLYLLDTNLEENHPIDRLITGHLYGGDRETRCVQEMVLGIGGIRLLRKLDIEPHVFHLNEGHSAFLTLELARELTIAGQSFADAAREVRGRCVFTTHTPVAAGHDEFLPSLVEHCFGPEYAESLGLTLAELLDLGRVAAGDEAELFGLTPLALKMCRSTNGVSRIHGAVSRELWKVLWPESTAAETPITHVTNGVHAPTWVAPLIRELYAKHIGPDWCEQECDARRWTDGVERITDEELWRAHRLLKQRLVAFIRHRLYHARVMHGESMLYAEAARTMFEPEALTIGFARRVAAYKRWSLILHDPERLMRLIDHAERPVQLVFAGKAHPQDQGAKQILQQLAQWKLDPRVMRRAVFIQDYDQEIARQLVQSVDVWLNVPRRPLEASGTSGEKVAMNGGLNLSVLDGWWPEGYDGTNGWAVGGAETAAASGAMPDEDARDAESLYRVLEDEVVPTFYDRDATGIPRRWVAMMKRSIETLVPAFNSDRMVQEYARKIYLGESK